MLFIALFAKPPAHTPQTPGPPGLFGELLFH